MNARLQAMGIQAPPPPLVKSMILGEFPLSEHAMTTIPEEDEDKQDQVFNNNQDIEEKEIEEKEIEHEDKNEPINLPGKEVDDQWYNVIDGPFDPPPNQPATDCTQANSVYLLTPVVCLFSFFISFLEELANEFFVSLMKLLRR